MKKKVSEFEILRTFAFIAVIFQHIAGVYVNQPNLSLYENVFIGIFFGFSKFGVSAFVFLSGLVMAKSLTKSFTYSVFLKKRFFSIIVPYLIFCLIFTLVYPDILGNGVQNYIISIANGSIHYHTWYIYMISIMYIFIPIIVFISKFFNKLSIVHANLTLALLVISQLILVYIYPLFALNPLTKFLFFDSATKNPIYFMNFFLCGAIISLNYEYYKKKLVKYWYLSVIFMAFAMLLNENRLFTEGFQNGVLNLNYIPTLTVLSAILSFSSIAFYLLLSIFMTRFLKFTEFLVFIGKYTFIGYLFHTIILQKVAFYLNLGTFYKYSLTFILTVILSIFTGIVYEKLQMQLTLKRRKND